MTNILLPIETINREIDFKLVLAAQLANMGHHIYIGQHDFLMELLPQLEGGIYLGKNIFKKRSNAEKGENYTLLKKHCFDVVYLHEEGAVFAGKEKDWKQTLASQYNINFFDENDVVCTWGDFQKNFDNQRSNGNVPIITTGHPRFDLYKPQWQFLFEKEVESLKKIYGDFVLINGNFGLANHGKGLDHVFSDEGDYHVENEMQRLKRVGFFAHSTKQLVSMVELTHNLALKFLDKKFIYRPHPSENHEYYSSLFKGVNNIIVNHSGSVNAWILAANTIIHDGCTTAIEATLAGKKVINYKATEDSDYDIWLPKQMGILAESIEEVIFNLQNSAVQDRSHSLETVSELMYNFEGDSFLALNNVLEKVLNRKNKEQTKNNLNPTHIAKLFYKQIIKEKLLQFHPQKRKDLIYHKRKFKGFDKVDIIDKIDLLKNKKNIPISVKIHNPYIIEIR